MIETLGSTSDRSDAPADRIDVVISALAEAWRRNPGKTLMQIVDRAARYTDVFVPGDISDRRMLYGLRKLGPGRPEPTAPGSADEDEIVGRTPWPTDVA